MLRNRKDHWLPRGYLRGFVGPSRASLEKPLWCFFKDTEEWEDVSAAEIGYEEGFYDYAPGTDSTAAMNPDSIFARLEREYPSRRNAMVANKFADWQEHRQFLLEFVEMLPLRSPLGMKHLELEARSLRGATVLAVNEDSRTITPDSLEMRPLPENAVRNFTVSKMLRQVTNGQGWTAKLDWCLRCTDVESEGFCTTDQAIFVEGPIPLTDEHGRMTWDMLHHPDALVYFPLCWQACLFGSPLRFNKAYGRAINTHMLRAKQKENADRFVVSPVAF